MSCENWSNDWQDALKKLLLERVSVFRKTHILLLRSYDAFVS